MNHRELLDHFQESIMDFSPIELVGVLVVLRNEFLARTYDEAADLVERAARSFASDVVGPFGPSDNGPRAPGEEGTDASS